MAYLAFSYDAFPRSTPPLPACRSTNGANGALQTLLIKLACVNSSGGGGGSRVLTYAHVPPCLNGLVFTLVAPVSLAGSGGRLAGAWK